VDELTRMGYVSGTTTAEDIFRTDLIESLEK